MRILLTGATGFAAGHLAEALLAGGQVELVGISRRTQWPEELRHLAGRVDFRAGDVGDRNALEALLRDVQPAQIYHLAGYAHAGQSFREPDAAWAGNLSATRSLYEAVLRWGGKPRVLFVGSGLIYGDAESAAAAFDENHPLRPTSPYAASKAAADLASYQYMRSTGLDIVRARPFNHVGPRQSPDYAIPNFARQLVASERGGPPVIETGGLSSHRDLTDVRDVVRAYLLLMQHGRTGEAYNIGSGQTQSMQTVLDRLLALSTLRGVQVKQRPDLVRSTDTAAARADAGKLQRETGWSPSFTLDQTLADTLAYWRERE